MGRREGPLEKVTPKDFDLKFLNGLKRHDVLGFKKDGEQQYWRVAKFNKRKQVWWFEPWRVFTPDEFAELEKDRVGND